MAPSPGERGFTRIMIHSSVYGRVSFAWMPLALVVLVFTTWSSNARNIRWFCNPMSVNVADSGKVMDAGFRFELGVFTGGFTPTGANTGQWAANWFSAQRAVYNDTNGFFTAEHTVTGNTGAFTVGAKAYVWGFGGVKGDEWILFRAPTWTWPSADPLNPIGLNWNAASATQVIVGSINPSGGPYLMKSAAVSASLPPSTPWPQWQAEALRGIAMNAPGDDPDGDGIRNDIEFVFGMLPLTPDAVPPTITLFSTVGDQRFLQITIPRRADRPAALSVEVSDNLTHWSAGSAFTQQVSSGPAFLTVRSLVQEDDATPRHFMRTAISVVP